MKFESRHVLPFLAGAAVGAVVAIFTTKQNGRELRELLAEGIGELKHTMVGALGSQVTKAGVEIAAAGRTVQRTGTKMQE